HHICPRKFLKGMRANTRATPADSVMNLSWMSQKTNFEIGEKSPLDYFAAYRDNPAFERILASQLIPLGFANRTTFEKADYRDFLFARARLFAARLRAALPDAPITLSDK
ncbi:MAG TPA: hypothetical protein VFX31_00090, partial [Ktedonobacterales bacterium]|nr:hypothetical protein [Ktedonobacterales bacterium]